MPQAVVTSATIATWNVDWAKPSRVDEIQGRLGEIDADILVLTETTTELELADGHIAEGGTDWGYPEAAGRRKVLLWSRWPLGNISNEALSPPGRHVSATVESPLGPLRVHAVCVPWSFAHVTHGRKDRTSWEEHELYLGSLRETLRLEATDPTTSDLPVIVAGDINQHSGHQHNGKKPYGGRSVREAWAAALAEAKLLEATDNGVIDKIAVGPALVATSPRLFPADDRFTHNAVACAVHRRY